MYIQLTFSQLDVSWLLVSKLYRKCLFLNQTFLVLTNKTKNSKTSSKIKYILNKMCEVTRQQVEYQTLSRDFESQQDVLGDL